MIDKKQLGNVITSKLDFSGIKKIANVFYIINLDKIGTRYLEKMGDLKDLGY
ncbi:MAG TPA: hypothetical protein P5513_07625 [Candidatus Diapherotrites archaeon]|nr:hypothetical protein [Candidatus Diapherotrites archaeon]